MKRVILSIICVIGLCGSSFGQRFNVRWHNESRDTTVITDLLKEFATDKVPVNSARTAWFGRKFVGTPYVAHTLEGPTEILTVNLEELDCTTFIENCLALSVTAGEGRQGWQDFIYNLRKIRYRGGEVDGYASRLHYICDWVMDNVHRGTIKDVTSESPACKYIVRTIDYMSAHAGNYPALADSVALAGIKKIENGYRNHRFPYIKTADLGIKEIQNRLREGDILAFVSNLKDLDVTHMGMVVKENDKIYVLHASSTNHQVEISKLPLADFVKRNRNWIGVRILRVTD